VLATEAVKLVTELASIATSTTSVKRKASTRDYLVKYLVDCQAQALDFQSLHFLPLP